MAPCVFRHFHSPLHPQIGRWSLLSHTNIGDNAEVFGRNRNWSLLFGFRAGS